MISDAEKTPKVKIQPEVSEAWIREVIESDVSPTRFAEWVLTTLDLPDRLREYLASEEHPSTAKAAVTYAARGKSSPERSSGRDNYGQATNSEADTPGWTRSQFLGFLDVIARIPDLEWSLALLHAYEHLGPVPTSEQLRDICGFQDEHAWQQELRIAKQRLTLQARKMDASSIFPRAKAAQEGKRLHPIEPRLFLWLKDWIESRRRGEGDGSEVGLPEPELWGPTINDLNKYGGER